MNIVITGASSGLGAALAVRYARIGAALFLTGRDGVRLNHVAAECRGRGAMVETAQIDVTDRAGLAAWIGGCDQGAPLDLVIANAGISAATHGGAGLDTVARATFAVNLDGVLNTVLPVVPLMRDRGRGQIAIMSSLAGFRGFAGSAAYCASKAAVRVWGEGLRAELAPVGIGVSVICPGFVSTPMTDANRFRMPFLMGPERAADIIVRGLAANRGRIAFPAPMVFLARLIGGVPDSWMDRLAALFPTK